MRAAIYLRISEDRTGDELGVTRQREDCEALCARRGWEVHDVYIDNDVSATRAKVRPQWERMIADVEAGHVKVIVGWTIDRTLRSGRDRLRTLEVGKEHSVTIALVRGSDMDLSTPAGRLTADILGAVALNEVETKADRQRRAAEQRAGQGLPWCSRRPFGYERGGMIPRPDEAALLREAYTAVLSGASVRGIAQRWNAAGVSTSTGARWHGATVSQLLRNARNAGIRTRGRDKKLVEVGPAAWPPIVDETTYRAVVAILTEPGRRVGPDRERKYLLTGIALCGRCGDPMGSGRATSTGARIYTCKRHHHLSRAGEPVDDWVSQVVVARLSRPDALATFAPAEPESAGPDLNVEAVALRSRLDSLAVEFADGLLTASQLRVITERLRAKLGEVETRMRAASRSPVLADLAGHPDVADRWKKLPLDRKRAVVNALLIVTILPAGRGRGFNRDTVKVEPRV